MKILKHDQRYLFARPRGGLNDVLVQIEKCRRYATKHDRVLILDTLGSGLRMPFDEIFIANENFGCELLIWNETIAKDMDVFASVEPKALTNRISQYQGYWDGTVQQVRDVESNCLINFDFTTELYAQLLVYEQAGGGIIGLSALRHMSLLPAIADDIAQRLIPLGLDYDAIHIRHTDYVTDYEPLFVKSKSMFIGRRLLICSDNANVKQCAQNSFETSTTLLSVAEIPDTDGQPLFLSDAIDPYSCAIDFLSDLTAMARSQTFLFSRLSSRNQTGGAFSGFAILADLLRQEPKTLRALFDHASSTNRSALFGDNSTSMQPIAKKISPKQKIRRTIGRMSQWVWNFKARRRSIKNGLKIRRKSY